MAPVLQKEKRGRIHSFYGIFPMPFCLYAAANVNLPKYISSTLFVLALCACILILLLLVSEGKCSR